MYSDFFSINKNFQTSINLELDLNNDIKIDEYIPTSDICDVIKIYIKSFLGLEKNRSTLLIGPYGKGKSFLLLILTYLFGKNKNSVTWNSLVTKIKKIDLELYEYLIKTRDKNITLLPVIINSNYDNISQSFQIALNDSLHREGLDFIIPYSVYEVCISLLDKWCIQKNIEDEIFSKCLEVNAIDLNTLRNGLVNFSPDSYKQFEKLYNCVNIGLEFNPLINNDVVKVYTDVSQSLSEYGYSGMFIVFDEFSKFIESNSSNVIKDLKIIQDFAEAAVRSSKTSQLNICCVTHKSISLYETSRRGSIGIDSFKTVEGRFKEIKFNRSIEDNYQIISSSITKRSGANKIISLNLTENEEFYKHINSLSLFDSKNVEKDLFKGCFPLNPLTVRLLIQISEYVAQNERTLFTFLSDTDDDSFNSFLRRKESGLFNVDKVYDYFSNLLQKEETNHIRNVWYRAESVLAKIDDVNERIIIKSLAILLMVNDSEKLPSSELVVSLASGIDLFVSKKIIDELVEKHYIRRNLLNNFLSFALSNTKQIDDAVEICKKTKLKNIKYGEIIGDINERNYLLPRKYNQENKITRFYRIVFLPENEFLYIKSFNYFFENNYCDGIVIYLLMDKISENEIFLKTTLLNDKRIIVKCPSKTIEPIFYESITRYACLKEVRRQIGIDEITATEIDLLLEETENDVRLLTEQYFTNSKFFSIVTTKEKNLNSLLSSVMDSIYTEKIIFNNELINKKNVTTQYQKAINNVINWILEGEQEFNYSETSPEASVKRAIFDNNDLALSKSTSALTFRKIIEDLKAKIIFSVGKRIFVKEILKKYKAAPYGIRNGVMPLILAKAISELSDNVILYFQSKEIELNAVNLVKAIQNDKYQILLSKSSLEQKNYLFKMLLLFDVRTTNNFRNDTYNLARAIKKFFIGLPQILRLATINSNFIEIDQKFLEYKTLFLTFNLNPHEAIFEKPKKIFETNKYQEILKIITAFVKSEEFLISPFKQKLIVKIKSIFDIELNTSLKMGFSDFIAKYANPNQRLILEQKEKNILNLVLTDISYNDDETLDKLSKIATGQFIEDWDSNKQEQLFQSMIDFESKILNAESIKLEEGNVDNLFLKDVKVEGNANLLKNNIESVLDEFSGSVSLSEKIAVLSILLKKML